MHVLILNCIQVHYTIYWILFQALFGENTELSRAFALFMALKNGVLRKNYRELKLMWKYKNAQPVPFPDAEPSAGRIVTNWAT